MSEIIECFYAPLLEENGFTREPENRQYGSLGDCWRLSGEIGEGTYWTYGQKDLYDIKIHNFSFHEDFLFEFSIPECLSITRYDSISGEELSPYRRLSAGCIKTFIGGYAPYKALIHKNIPIRSIGIEIAPAYYEDYLKKLYPEAELNPVEAFRKIDQTSDFPEMSQLLTQIRDYRGEGIAAKLFYEGKVAEAVSMVVEYQKKHPDQAAHRLSQQDIESIRTVAAYLSDHYASDILLERLTQIACMGTTKLKSCFKKCCGCTITEYVQQRRMSQAEYLLAHTELTVGQVARTVGYSTSSRFAELFRKSTGLLPLEYRKTARRR
ncbi:MAG: AraC family transcriptional regulator [Eubacteriales bacterium]|nr:AraC family transcriptional regulator [Eubacteriales bacterium]